MLRRKGWNLDPGSAGRQWRLEETALLASLHQEIAALPEAAVILAEDESHVNLLPWLRSTWIVEGCGRDDASDYGPKLWKAA